MPDYRKKKVKRSKPPRSVKHQRDYIEMKPAQKRVKKQPEAKEQNQPKTNLKVLKGNREKIRKRQRILAAVALSLVLIISFAWVLTPTGLPDQISIWYNSIGGGDFPVSLSGANALNVQKFSTHFFTLTDTSLESYSLGGKDIMKNQHGFSAPVMLTSPTRALVYDQGGTGYKIYKINKPIIESNSSDSIIAADISRSGAFAIAVKSSKYASQVCVYNKSGKTVYEWNSSVEIVSDVALSPNGKKIAVATFNSQNGVYISKIYVLKFNSATPLFVKEYSGTLIHSLEAEAGKGFFAVSDSAVDYISWGKYAVKSFTTDYNVRMLRSIGNKTVVVSTRLNDKKDNVITVLNKNGNQKYQISWKQTITDISMIGNHIAVLSDTGVYLLGSKGETVRTGEAGFGGMRIVPVSMNNAVIVTDNLLNKVTLTNSKQ